MGEMEEQDNGASIAATRDVQSSENESHIESLFRQIHELEIAQEKGIQLKTEDKLKKWGMQMEAKGLSLHKNLTKLNISAISGCALVVLVNTYLSQHSLRIIDDSITNFLTAPWKIADSYHHAALAWDWAKVTGGVIILRPFSWIPYIERAVGKSSQFAGRLLQKPQKT